VICPREDELLDALGRGFIGAELDTHVATCASCTELRTVAGALLDERMHAIAEAPVPSAGTMWWRMQMRHRQETQAMARRSLFVGQAVTLAIALALIAAIFGPHLVGELRAVIASINLTPLMLILATWALAAPIGGYIAIRQK
jgi:hypothetical protein